MLAKEPGAERAPTIRLGLEQPRLEKTGEPIMGQNKNKMQSENCKRQRALQQADPGTQWTTYLGKRLLPTSAAN